MKKLNKILLASLAVALFSCDNDFENPVEDFQVTAGTANFSKYVALGNSLTSGYTDNALFRSGQENSYPNILAGLMQPAGGGEFKTPWMQDNIGGFTNLPGFPGKLELKLIDGSLVPQNLPGETALDNIAAAGPYQNMGVPGAKSYHLVAPGYGNPALIAAGLANPYFSRFASSPTTTVVSDAVTQNPTFFSLWIGNNDVLGYAVSGGVGVDQTGNTNPSTYGSNDISDVNVVKDYINQALQALTANGAKGVIANIPSVTSVPYFTTVPAKPISGLSDAIAGALNSAQGYGAYNAGLAQARGAGLITDAEYQARLIRFEAGAVANGAVMIDKDLTNLAGLGLPSYRQTTAKDMIVFTAASILPQGYGTQIPLEDKYVLSEKEVAKAEAAVAKYNTAILELARAYDLAIVDTYNEMRKLSSQSGIRYYGNTYTTTFVSGGAFSLDGIHLTGTGYALVANMFVDAINNKYGSTLRKVFPGYYPGIKIP